MGKEAMFNAKAVVDLLEEIGELMKLHGENPFKVRAFEKASRSVAGCENLSDRLRQGTLTQLPGVGNSIAEIVQDFVKEGQSKVRDELRESLPEGLLELVKVPGLGPKKARVLIDELGIKSLGELEYACRENRLLKLKGFGLKVQQAILEGVLFLNSHLGQMRLPDARTVAAAWKDFAAAEGLKMVETGELRRHCEVLKKLEFLFEVNDLASRTLCENLLQRFLSSLGTPDAIRVHYVNPGEFGSEWLRTTGSAEHLHALGLSSEFEQADTEEEIYARLKLPWIPPELRETGDEVGWVRKGELPRLLPWDGIRGIFHNHTVLSDGNATLEEMVTAAEKTGYEYIGISDHSQSSVYAQGLRPDTLLEQEQEIRRVQEKHPDIRIFWGIESDILADGSLDYSDEILGKFDFVIASIHARFQMDRKAMTERILTALRNPYTRFLGHPTGRILLGRKAYDVDMELILREAAQHGVAVELNANPLRLDVDWRWGPVMRDAGTLTSVNPDAHAIEGIEDTFYGIAMARKAMIPVEQVVNAKNVKEVEKWLRRG